MADLVLRGVLEGRLEVTAATAWLHGDLNEDEADSALRDCSPNDFVVYFLSYIRNQTQSLSPCEGVTEFGARVHRRSVSEPTPPPAPPASHTASQHSAHRHSSRDIRDDVSPNREKRRSGRKVKTKLFVDSGGEVAGGPQSGRLPVAAMERLQLQPPPKHANTSDWSPSAASSRSSTPRQRRDNTLADYIVHKPDKKKRKSKQSEEEPKHELDISSIEAFPEIGSRKASSLRVRTETRRIKPTHIDKKSVSLNNFNDIQQASPLALKDNAAFIPSTEQRQDNGFETERDILKREKHLLIEKFNSISATSSPKYSKPVIKVTSKESLDDKCYVNVDINKVCYKNKVDCLVELYSFMLTDGLVYGYNAELLFLLNILFSKQTEEVYSQIEVNLKDNLYDNILRSIHNCMYFAVRSLWGQRGVLEVILDKHSLKLLGEVRVVRGLCPELAKCLLNAYGVRSDMSDNIEQSNASDVAAVPYNVETDNAENFPSTLSFHAFKKQRDMFYEIHRWYTEQTSSPIQSGPSLRSRVRILLSGGHGGGQGNAAALWSLPALASLFVQHLLHTVREHYSSGRGLEARINKLNKRLTQKPQPDSDLFPTHEHFYREVVIRSESSLYRACVRDALANDLLYRVRADTDSAGRCSGGASSSTSIQSECVWSVQCGRSVGRLLGLDAALPYCTSCITNTSCITTTPAATLHQLQAAVHRRDYSQPALDLIQLVRSGSLVALAAVTEYLHVLARYDPVAIRTRYYVRVLTELKRTWRAARAGRAARRVPSVLIKCMLSSVLHEHCTKEFLYSSDLPDETENENVPDEGGAGGSGGEGASGSGGEGGSGSGGEGDGGNDGFPLVAVSGVLSITASIRTVLAHSSPPPLPPLHRHVTPLRVALPVPPTPPHHGGSGATATGTTATASAGSSAIQRRLEAALLKAAGGSARKVMELVSDRAAARCVTELRPILHAHRVQPCSVEVGPITCCVRALYERVYVSMSSLLPPGGSLRALQTITARVARDRMLAACHTDNICPAALAALHNVDMSSIPVISSPTPNTTTSPHVCHSTPVAAPPSSHIVPASPIPFSPYSPAPESPFSPVVPSVSVSSPVSAPAVLQHNTSFPYSSSSRSGSPSYNANANTCSVAEAIMDLKEAVCSCLSGMMMTSSSRYIGAMLSAALVAGHATCRTNAKRAIVQLTIDLCVIIACRFPTHMCIGVVRAAETVWTAASGQHAVPLTSTYTTVHDESELQDIPDRCGGGGDSRAPTPDSDGDDGHSSVPSAPPSGRVIIDTTPADDDISSSTHYTHKATSDDDDILSPLTRVICPRNVALLVTSPPHDGSSSSQSPTTTTTHRTSSPCTSVTTPPNAQSGRHSNVQTPPDGQSATSATSAPIATSAAGALGWLASTLVTRGWISADILTDSCVALYRYEYDQMTLSVVSECMRHIERGLLLRGNGGDTTTGGGGGEGARLSAYERI